MKPFSQSLLRIMGIYLLVLISIALWELNGDNSYLRKLVVSE